LVLLLACYGNARAGLVITAGNTSLAAGSSGYVPVYIRSDNGIIDLASTSFEFLITPTAPTRLDFTKSPDPSVDPTFKDATYVFFGFSADKDFDIPLGTAGQTNVPNDTFDGADQVDNAPFVALGTVNELLGMLPVTTATQLPPVAGDMFKIDLVAGSPSTSFSDADGNPVPVDEHNAGTVTITAASSAAPEPSTWFLGLQGLAALAVVRYGRRRGVLRLDRTAW
jgi:MYXO-CTERM domain-containing protein